MRHPYVILLAVLLIAGVAYGADTPISTPAFGPALDVLGAWDVVPLGDGFLAIWAEGPPCGVRELRGMRLDGNGLPRDPESFLVVPAQYETSIVSAAPDGGDAYIAWRSSDGGAGTHVTRVNADATVTTLPGSIPIAATVMRISDGNILFLGSQQYVGDPLTVTLADRAGAVVRSGVTLVAAPVGSTDLVSANGAFLIGWAGSDGLHVTSVSPAAVAANNVPTTPAVLKTTSVSFLRLASDGVHSMAFWFDSSAHQLRGLLLSTSGAPLGDSMSIGSFTPVAVPTVVPVSDGYVVLAREVANCVGQITAIRVSFDGTLQSVQHRPAIAVPVAAAQNGERIMAVWDENRFATSKGGQVVAGPIADDGSIGSGAIVSLAPMVQHVRKLVPFAGGAVALWTDSAPNDRVIVGRVTSSGQPVDGAGLHLRESIYDQANSGLATDGERLFVAWTEGDPSSGSQTLYGAAVSFGSSPSVIVKQLATDAGGESDVGVTWNGQTFTIVYQRYLTNSFDLAALRVDRSGNLVDPAPIALTPARDGDENPRLSWNGSDYLLVWQRAYDPFFYIGESCYPPQPPLPAEVFAQRFSAALTPLGAQIDLARTTNYDDYLLDAQSVDVSFAGGLWLVLWFDKAAFGTRFARIDTSGARLEPLNGRELLGSYDAPILVPAADGWTVGAHEGYGRYGAGRGLALARISVNGQVTILDTVPLSGTSAVEAFALTPVPVVAYKRSVSSTAYIGALLPRARAVHP